MAPKCTKSASDVKQAAKKAIKKKVESTDKGGSKSKNKRRGNRRKNESLDEAFNRLETYWKRFIPPPVKKPGRGVQKAKDTDHRPLNTEELPTASSELNAILETLNAAIETCEDKHEKYRIEKSSEKAHVLLNFVATLSKLATEEKRRATDDDVGCEEQTVDPRTNRKLVGENITIEDQTSNWVPGQNYFMVSADDKNPIGNPVALVVSLDGSMIIGRLQSVDDVQQRPMVQQPDPPQVHNQQWWVPNRDDVVDGAALVEALGEIDAEGETRSSVNLVVNPRKTGPLQIQQARSNADAEVTDPDISSINNFGQHNPRDHNDMSMGLFGFFDNALSTPPSDFHSDAPSDGIINGLQGGFEPLAAAPMFAEFENIGAQMLDS